MPYLENLPIGEFMPDQPEGSTQAGLNRAENVIPYGGAYRSVRKRSAYTASIPSAYGKILNAISAELSDGRFVLIVGTETKLLRWLGGEWQDISNEALEFNEYGGGNDWVFATAGNMVLAANGVDKIQAIDLTNEVNKFVDLSEDAPRAEVIFFVRENLFALRTGGEEGSIRWAAQSDYSVWNDAALGAEQFALRSGGAPVGGLGGEVGFIFQKDKIWRFNFVGGQVVFQADELPFGVGIEGHKNLLLAGELILFIGNSGIYSFDPKGNALRNIGYGKIVSSYLKNPLYDISKTRLAKESDRSLVYFALYDNADVCQDVLAYNYVEDKWSVIKEDIITLFNGRTDIARLSDDPYSTQAVDDVDTRFTSPIYKGGSYFFAFIDRSERRVCFLASGTKDAVLETNFIDVGQIAAETQERVRKIDKISPLARMRINEARLNVALGEGGLDDREGRARFRLDAKSIIGEEAKAGVFINRNSLGFYPTNSFGRYFSARIELSGAWDDFQSLSLNYQADGLAKP